MHGFDDHDHVRPTQRTCARTSGDHHCCARAVSGETNKKLDLATGLKGCPDSRRMPKMDKFDSDEVPLACCMRARAMCAAAPYAHMRADRMFPVFHRVAHALQVLADDTSIVNSVIASPSSYRRHVGDASPIADHTLPDDEEDQDSIGGLGGLHVRIASRASAFP